MKTVKILLPLLGAALLSSCIKETVPMGSSVTAEQVAASPAAIESQVAGFSPSMTATYYLYGEQYVEYDLGYPGITLVMDHYTHDIYPCGDAGYNHFSQCGRLVSLGDNYALPYVTFFTEYKYIRSANTLIGLLKSLGDGLNDENKIYLATAYTYRALNYWLLANQYYPAEITEGTIESKKGYKIPDEIYPGWNYVISRKEVQNNISIEGLNNPDPSQAIDPVVD